MTLSTDTETAKESNPKDVVGSKKTPFHHIPVNVLAQLGLAMLEGALKYGSHNYRAVGVKASVYYDAMFRHAGSWWEGEDIDPDSGLNHLAKVMACCAIILDAQQQELLNDDRPIKSVPFLQECNRLAKEICERYPNPAEPYTQIP
jgi:hypothetical protein